MNACKQKIKQSKGNNTTKTNTNTKEQKGRTNIISFVP